MVELFVNSGDADQMLHSAASDLGLHCLPVICLGVSSLQWVNYGEMFVTFEAQNQPTHLNPCPAE